MNVGRFAAIGVLGIAGWLGGAAFVAAPALAAACADGATCSPDSLSVSGVLLADTGVQTLTSSTFSAQFDEQVYRDPNNEYCDDCLDWLLKVSNTSASGGGRIETINISDFGGFTSDMGVLASNSSPNGGAGGSKAPSAVHPNGDGSVLNWQFQGNTAAELGPGQTTVWLEVETNATTYQAGLVSAQDGSTAYGNAYAPNTEPNPNTPEAPWVPVMGLMGGVAVGGFALRRRHDAHPAA